jgi:hypothetical protein
MMLPGEAFEPGYPGYIPPANVEAEVSSTQSAVSWGAVFAGGVTAAAVSAILALFGAGLGLATVSPWAGAGVSAATFTVLAAIWLIIVQWVSSAFGGYMAGRLRTKWVSVHTDEVFFRDTAHGFLAWAVGTLIGVAVLTMATGSVVNNGAHVAASMTSSGNTATRYYVDLLFRQNTGGNTAVAGASMPGVTDQDMRQEAGAILAEGVANGGVSTTDSTYLAQLVSEKTGLAPADASARVTDVLNREHADVVKAKQVADASRKAVSGAAIYTFIALLIGAFIASVAGAIGGRLRDSY